MSEGYRSISDPDLTSVDEDKERASVSSAEMELSEVEAPRGVVIGNVKQRGSSMSSSDCQRIRVRYSDNSLERSEVSKMLENLKSLSSISMGQQNGSAHHHSNQQAPPSGKSSLKWTIGKKLKGGKSKESGGKAKKMSKGFHSSENILEQSQTNEVQGGGGVAGGCGEGEGNSNRSSSDSPQDSQPPQQQLHSPVPKKKNTTGIFGKKKKKTFNAVVPLQQRSPSPHDNAFDKEGSTPPPADTRQEEGQRSPTAENEDGASQKSGEGVSGIIDHAHPRKAEQASGIVFNLDTLVLPVNKNWTRCGYLWLRMKLPNGRYAWTHIVSWGGVSEGCVSFCVCVGICHRGHHHACFGSQFCCL